MPVFVTVSGNTWLLWGTLYVQIDAADLAAAKVAFPNAKTWPVSAAQHAANLAASHTTVAGSLILNGAVTVS